MSKGMRWSVNTLFGPKWGCCGGHKPSASVSVASIWPFESSQSDIAGDPISGVCPPASNTAIALAHRLHNFFGFALHLSQSKGRSCSSLSSRSSETSSREMYPKRSAYNESMLGVNQLSQLPIPFYADVEVYSCRECRRMAEM